VSAAAAAAGSCLQLHLLPRLQQQYLYLQQLQCQDRQQQQRLLQQQLQHQALLMTAAPSALEKLRVQLGAPSY
jgi:hypothetical protein